MTDHSQAELVTAYLDADLSDSQQEEFELMLEKDPDAKREISQMMQMLEMVAALPELSAPQDFYENVAKGIRKRRLDRHSLLLSLISVPFQVLSVLIILLAAVTFLMIELDQDLGRVELESDPSAQQADIQKDEL